MRKLWKVDTTVDGNQKSGGNAPVEVGSLSHDLPGFVHPRWLFGISSSNSSIVTSMLCII